MSEQIELRQRLQTILVPAVRAAAALRSRIRVSDLTEYRVEAIRLLEGCTRQAQTTDDGRVFVTGAPRPYEMVRRIDPDQETSFGFRAATMAQALQGLELEIQRVESYARRGVDVSTDPDTLRVHEDIRGWTHAAETLVRLCDMFNWITEKE